MKKLSKTAALMLAAMMAVSSVGCGENTNSGGNGGGGSTGYDSNYDNGGTVVEIKFWYSGMGVDYLEEMIQTFNQKQSKWNVKYTSSSSASSLTSTLGLEDVDTTDLYLVEKVSDTWYLEPLDGLLASTADGDSKPLKEKFEDFYLTTETSLDGNIYGLTTGGGTLGLVYNTRLFEKAGIEVTPRTSDELAAVCEKLKNVGVTPFIHFTGGGYWSYFLNVWQCQYDGFDYYLNNFYACVDTDGVSPSKKVFTTKDGRYQMLKALAKVLTPENVEAGSNSVDHITAQTMFLNADIAMMVNGAWLSNEMKSTGDMEDYSVMKNPVVSGIRDKLTTVKSDQELRSLVSAIDAVTDKTKDISEYQSGENYIVDGKEISAADWNRVEEARNTVSTAYNGQSACIPKYSTEKEGAMEFLKFYYSDEGYQIYTKHTHMLLPMELSEGEIDMSDWNMFEKTISDVFRKSKYQIGTDMKCKHKIFLNGGASPYPDSNYIVEFCTYNEGDRKTADEVWAEILKAVDKKYDTWIANIK